MGTIFLLPSVTLTLTNFYWNYLKTDRKNYKIVTIASYNIHSKFHLHPQADPPHNNI